MADFNVRSDSVDVEQIMRQIRARIREKRGADYTEAELQQLAEVKLETFLDPRGLRSDLVEQFRRHRVVSEAPPNYEFEDTTLYETHRGVLRFIRRLLNPVLKLFFNPNRIVNALHIQAQVNAEFHRRFRQREEMDPLFYEVIHNLVVEITRLGIEVHNLKMRVESMSSRLDFDERRARSLEGVVQYRPGALARPAGGPAAAEPATGGRSDTRGRGEGGGEAGGPRAEPGAARGESGERRRRRRRRRRRPGATLADSSGAGQGAETARTAGGAPEASRGEAGGQDAFDQGGDDRGGDQDDEDRGGDQDYDDRGGDQDGDDRGTDEGGGDDGASDQ
jgi:hypothetical protein